MSGQTDRSHSRGGLTVSREASNHRVGELVSGRAAGRMRFCDVSNQSSPAKGGVLVVRGLQNLGVFPLRPGAALSVHDAVPTQ